MHHLPQEHSKLVSGRGERDGEVWVHGMQVNMKARYGAHRTRCNQCVMRHGPEHALTVCLPPCAFCPCSIDLVCGPTTPLFCKQCKNNFNWDAVSLRFSHARLMKSVPGLLSLHSLSVHILLPLGHV